MSFIMIGVGCLLLGLIIGITLSFIYNILKFPNGVIIGMTKEPSIDLNDSRLQRGIYPYSQTKKFDSEEKASTVFSNIVMNCKKCNIFFGDTKVQKANDIVAKNDLIAITTLLSNGIYSTSYEMVSTLHETPDYFEMCLSACAENLIDGYYGITVTKKSSEITIDYQKVQNLIPYLMKVLISKKSYDDMNTTSVKDTVEGLFKISS
jgi:hypothetical protein